MNKIESLAHVHFLYENHDLTFFPKNDPLNRSLTSLPLSTSQVAPSQLTIPSGRKRPICLRFGRHSDFPTDTGRPLSFSHDLHHHWQSTLHTSLWGSAPCLVISFDPTKTLHGSFSYSSFTNNGTEVHKDKATCSSHSHTKCWGRNLIQV